MRRSKIETIREVIVTQMNHWFYTAIALTALGLFNCKEPHFLLCVCMGILPVYGYILREKIRVFPAFLLLSILPAVFSIVFPIGDIAVKALLIVFCIFYGIYSIYIRTRGNNNWDAPVAPVVAFGVIGGLFILLESQRKTGWDSYFIFIALVYFTGFLVDYFIAHFLNFITVNDSSAANIPERAIFETGIRQTCFFTGGATLFLALVANVDWLAGLVSSLKRAIVAFISKYLQITPAQSDEPDFWMNSMGGGGFDMFADSTAEPSIIWIILQYVAIVVVCGGLLIAGIYGIYKGYKVLQSGFLRERRGKVQKLSENDDVYEKVEIVHKERKKGGGRFSLEAFSVTERIRKVYRKKAEKERYTLVKDGDIQALNFMTARECCELLQASGLQQAYEKARYSNANCINEDLKRAKE